MLHAPWAQNRNNMLNPNVRALIIRTGFWGPLYYNHDTERPEIVLVII